MPRSKGRPFVKGDPRIKPNPGGRKKAKTLDQELDAAERQLRVELLQIAKDRTCEPGPRIKAIQALRQLRETSAQSRRHYVIAVPAQLTVEDWAKSVEAWEQFDLNRSRLQAALQADLQPAEHEPDPPEELPPIPIPEPDRPPLDAPLPRSQAGAQLLADRDR